MVEYLSINPEIEGQNPAAADIGGQCFKTFYGRKLRIFVINQCLSLASPSSPSLMFESKAGAYPSESPLRYFTIGPAPGLIHKHQTRLESPARYNSSFLRRFVNHGRKKFYNIGPRRKWREKARAFYTAEFIFSVKQNTLAYAANIRLGLYKHSSLLLTCVSWP